MKIMTFNIQSGRRHPDCEVIDLDFCARVIAKYSPDVVGLNEVNRGGEYGDQPRLLAEKLGYPYYYFAQAITLAAPYGNAVLSKYPLKDPKTVIVPDPPVRDEDVYYETRCVLRAAVALPDGADVRLFVSHFGLAKAERRNAAETVCALLGDAPERTVFMGDLNLRPGDAQLDGIRRRLADAADGCPGGNGFTWPSDRPTKKLDYIFASRDAKISGAAPIPEIGSDHLAYMAEIDFPAARPV